MPEVSTSGTIAVWTEIHDHVDQALAQGGDLIADRKDFGAAEQLDPNFTLATPSTRSSHFLKIIMLSSTFDSGA